MSQVVKEVEKIVQVPVEVERVVTKETVVTHTEIEYMDRVVEVPVDRVVEVDRIVHKEVPVYVDRVVEKVVEKIVPVPHSVPEYREVVELSSMLGCWQSVRRKCPHP